MARLPDAFIDELLARIDIVELISTRVPLKRVGREYHACCPFHNEKTPSFTVSAEKQFYHCFGCGAHGSALKFLMEYDRLAFLDAVEELAKQAGMEVPRSQVRRDADDETPALLDALAQAARFYAQQLTRSERAQAYLRKRGLDAGTIERFGIGWAPEGWDALKQALGRDEGKLGMLERAGMLTRSDSGRIYDKFRARIMFPIHDRRGRVIAFGGRVLEKDDGPKYLNSPETRLFHKGRELYGLYQVRRAHSKVPALVVVEGYMDVVSLFQFGIDTAVATLGTATTPEHVETLFRTANDVYFCFDGDRAGRAAAWRALLSTLPKMRDGRQAFFLFLPEGEDPDSIVRSEGALGFQRRLDRATPLSTFFFDELEQGVNLATLDGKARLAERARPHLAAIPEGAFRDLMQARLSQRTGLDGAKTVVPAPAGMARPRGAAPRRSLVRSVIVLLLHRPALALSLQPPYLFAALRQPGIELLMALIRLIHERPKIGVDAILEHFAGNPEGDELARLALSELPGDPETWKLELDDAIQQLQRQTIEQRIGELQEQGNLGAEEKEELRALLASRLR